MLKLKTLTAKSLRGITDTTLPLDGHSVVLLGENGAGKSSFVDALEFFFTGRVSHLEGAQAISTTRHAPHIHAARDDTLVEIEFDRPPVTISRTFRGLSDVPVDLQDFIQQGAGSTFILRRKNLLDFILARPADRYAQLAAIIGVEDLDKVERALMKARDDLLDQKDSIECQIRSEELKLNELLDEVAIDEAQLLGALNRKLAELKQPPLNPLDEIEARKVAVVAQSRAPQDAQRSVKVQSVLESAAAMRSDVLFHEVYRQLWNEVEALRQNATHVRDMLFQEVLASSRRLIADFALDYCPVCQKPIEERETLLALLDKRVREAQQIAQKASGIKRLRSRLVDRIRDRIEEVEQLASQLVELEVPLDRSLWDRYTLLLSGLLPALQADPLDIHLPSYDEIIEAPEVAAFIIGVDESLTALKSEKKRLEPTEQDKRTVAILDLLTKVMDSRQSLKTLRPQGKVKAAAYREIAAIYDCFVSTKRAEVQAIYRELESDIEHFFKLLHADEGYRDVKLEVQEGRRASTEIRMNFYEREQEDPRAFNSEGHLDSLGLCVFLAFVKRFNTGFPIMVLDDVVSSIDSGHRQRICELLFQEFADCQLFITTHDYVWFEELCAHQRAYNQGHLFVNYRILDWSVDSGPRLDKHRSRWEQVEERLANGDKEGAAADTRRVLEFLLYEVVIATQAQVVLKRDGKYVVSELHAPFVSRIKKLVPEVYAEKVAVFRNLETNGIFGNLLAHNNPQAANASLEEIRGFANAVKSLEALFTCDQCGRFAMYYRDARLIKCSCGGIMWATR